MLANLEGRVRISPAYRRLNQDNVKVKPLLRASSRQCGTDIETPLARRLRDTRRIPTSSNPHGTL